MSPSMNCSSSDLDSTCSSFGEYLLSARKFSSPRRASGVSSVKVVGVVGSSTISPPVPHTNGATRTMPGSTPRPFCLPVVELRGRRGEVRVRPVGSGIRQPGLLEGVAVVVHDEARHVLRHARQLAVEGEGLERLGIEVVALDRVAVVEAGGDRIEHLARCVAAVVAVVDEEGVGRRAAGERCGELLQVVAAVGDLDELDLAARLGLVGAGEVAVDLAAPRRHRRAGG